ncbi:hypothetical protein I6U48_07525 [Clostridium sp. PL3]|uniref:Uncharacterized protein n=1 Tax=Clostridium thailandense TaxID=2794346 RepID=A0A949TUR6_9CLOT|nr:hypothetical protein [Clostridium thailandense]MBV7272768.1 hypothetical protein [Clostridium thailandense]
MSSYPIAMVFGILTTVIIFAILAIHPIFLDKTPFGIVPCVLLGFIESLFTFLIKPSNVSPIGPIHLVAFFGYGMVLSFILAKTNELFCKLILGQDSAKPVTK